MYFTKKGYELRLTAEEATEKKIKPEDYRSFQKTIELFNKSLTEQLDTLGNNKLNFFFPEDRIEKEGLDPRIIIVNNEENLKDVQTRVDEIQYKKVVLGNVVAETTINGSPSTAIGEMPMGTNMISYSAFTKCTLGVVSGYINAGGVIEKFRGWGFKPARGEFVPGLVPGLCKVYVASTGCDAYAAATLLGDLDSLPE